MPIFSLMGKLRLSDPTPLGDRALIIRLGESMDVATFRAVQALARRLDEHPLAAVLECIPAVATLTVYYDPLRATFAEMCSAINVAMRELETVPATSSRVVEIPVCYGGEFGSDLDIVAEHNGLTNAEVIEIHSGSDYLVHMLGFSPGFPYLGGMSERIATPRRDTPRMVIPMGSVGIAGKQTGVYPIATPGGWQLIGRTPLALFRPSEFPPTLLLPGDTVRFRPITVNEFHDRCEYL